MLVSTMLFFSVLLLRQRAQEKEITERIHTKNPNYQGVVTQVHNFSTQQTEAGGLPEVQGQPGLHNV